MATSIQSHQSQTQKSAIITPPLSNHARPAAPRASISHVAPATTSGSPFSFTVFVPLLLFAGHNALPLDIGLGLLEPHLRLGEVLRPAWVSSVLTSLAVGTETSKVEGAQTLANVTLGANRP